jgi:hypothetical protein
MKTWIVVLYVLSFLLPVIAAVQAWRGAKSWRARLEKEKRAIETVREEIPLEDRTQVLRERGVRFTTYTDAGYQLQNIEIAIVDSALAELRGPALLALLGVLLGAGASIWALYLPAA